MVRVGSFQGSKGEVSSPATLACGCITQLSLCHKVPLLLMHSVICFGVPTNPGYSHLGSLHLIALQRVYKESNKDILTDRRSQGLNTSVWVEQLHYTLLFGSHRILKLILGIHDWVRLCPQSPSSRRRRVLETTVSMLWIAASYAIAADLQDMISWSRCC